jgi:hypothetical protein
MKSLSNYWHKHGFKLMLVCFSVCIAIVVIVKRINGFHKKPAGKFLDVFKNLEAKYPQAFKRKQFRWTGDSKGELQCRSFLERKFKAPFPKVRPLFLRNPVTNGALLELDCFNSDLKLACEYHGEQHYKFVSHFHKSYEAFLNQKYRDQLKRALCKENGVYLIEVPFHIQDIDSFLDNATKEWTQHQKLQENIPKKRVIQQQQYPNAKKL